MPQESQQLSALRRLVMLLVIAFGIDVESGDAAGGGTATTPCRPLGGEELTRGRWNA